MFFYTLWTPLKNQPSKQNKGIKKSSPSKSQTLLYFCLFKEFLKLHKHWHFSDHKARQVHGLEIMSQNGEPGQQTPRLAVPSAFWGIAGEPDVLASLATCWWYHPILQLSRWWWCFLTCWVSEAGGGRKIYCFLSSPNTTSIPFQNSLESEARYRNGHLVREKQSEYQNLSTNAFQRSYSVKDNKV